MEPEVLSQIGTDSTLDLALLCDENNRVILATRYQLRNRPVINTPAASSLPDIKEFVKRYQAKSSFPLTDKASGRFIQ